MKTWEELVDELYGKRICVTISSPLCCLQTIMEVESVDSAMQIGDTSGAEMTWMLGNSSFEETESGTYRLSAYGMTVEFEIIN